MLFQQLSRPVKFAVVAVFITVILFALSGFSRTDHVQSFKFPYSGSSILDTKNETLGFSRIFVLSLPERTDKQDGVLIGASLSGFKFDFIDGVRGTDVPDKALPKGWQSEWGPATLGCWRGHMNIAHKMVKEGIQSALVLEDDADWDVMFKEQLREFATGAQAIQEVEKTPYSPYGDDWDLLWVGHCGTWSRTDQDGPYYLIPDDPTVPPIDRVYGTAPNRTPAVLSNNRTRMIYKGHGGRCTTGYAISLRGAQRLIYYQALNGAKSIDRVLSAMCGSRPDFKCISPYPTMIGVFKDAGDVSKDSDRVSVKGEMRKLAETRDIAYPVRLNMDRLISKAEKVRPQWAEGNQWPEIGRDALLPKGHVEWVTKEQFVI